MKSSAVDVSQKIDVSIIIVSHNTRDFVLKCLKSIFLSVKKYVVEVIVVENDSSDGSFEVMKTVFKQVRLIQTKKLIGYSEANNLGAKQAHGKFLFFLNPDTEVIDDAIDVLIDSCVKSGAQIASSQLLNPNRSIQPQGGSLPNLLNVAVWMFFIDDLPLINLLFTSYQQRNVEYFKHQHDDVGWVGGTALLITRELLDQLGGWDSHMFLYGEDIELCIRIHNVGQHIALFPNAKIIHHKQGSVGQAKRAFLGEIDGLLYIWKKHFPAWQLGVLRCLLFVGSWMRVLVFGILLNDEKRRATYLEAQKRARMA